MLDNIVKEGQMRLAIIAGANGSGKTTSALSFAQFSGVGFINADDEFEEVANFADGELTVLYESYYATFTGEL
jgi:cytidylate kinase